MFGPARPSILQVACALLSLLFFIVAVVEARIRSRSDGGPASGRSLLSILGILIQSFAFFLVSIGRLDPTSDMSAPASLLLSLIVLILGMGAVVLFRSSANALGNNWSVVARTRSKHSLITSGPFARVRHPIYAALLLLLIAWAVGLDHLLALILAVPIYVIGTVIRVREEEKLLINRFGEAYRAYVRATPAFIPRLS